MNVYGVGYMDTANIIDTIVRANEIQLKFIKKEGKNSYNYEVKQGIIDNSTVKYLKDKFSLLIEEFRNLNFNDYNIGSYNKTSDAFNLNINEIPNFTTIYNSINDESIDSINFKQLNEFTANFFAIKFLYKTKDINKEIIIFNRQNPSTGLTKKANIFWNGERFIISQDSFSLRMDIDCFYDSETQTMYIINRKYFEDIFNFKDFYSQKAKECLNKIEAQNILTNNSAFKHICLNDSNIIFRLAKIDLSNDLIDFNTHISEIKSIIKEDELNIYFTGNNKIQIDDNTSKETIKNILSLINDEYLTSRITKKNYVASTKQLSLLQKLYSTIIK